MTRKQLSSLLTILTLALTLQACAYLSGEGADLKALPLPQAAQMGYLEGVHKRLAEGADPNAPYGGFTPLHYAVIGKKPETPEVIQTLIRHGADPNKRSGLGSTPMSSARRELGVSTTPQQKKHWERVIAALEGRSIATSETASLVISGNSGQFLSPYTSDGVVAEWVNKAINAKMGGAAGSAVGAAAGAYAGQKLMENVPGGDLIGGVFGGMAGSKAGRAVGRDTAIAASGGWDHIRETSDQSFRSLQDMARYLSGAYGGSGNFNEVIQAADQVYPGLLKAVATTQ